MTTHELSPLPYAYDALEPYIDAKTMEIHYTKHHQGYCDKLNAALEKHQELKDADIIALLSNIEHLPEDIQGAVKNNGGGYLNHSLFWSMLAKDVPCEGEIAEALEKKFGSIDDFKKAFADAAATQFGSGWAWLVVNRKGELEVVSTPYQETPFTEGNFPILGLDVWEHAYYLQYQNRRADYIDAFWNVVNWAVVNENFITALTVLSGSGGCCGGGCGCSHGDEGHTEEKEEAGECCGGGCGCSH
jgi:Fe-Mn family superoxide dismutase